MERASKERVVMKWHHFDARARLDRAEMKGSSSASHVTLLAILRSGAATIELCIINNLEPVTMITFPSFFSGMDRTR